MAHLEIKNLELKYRSKQVDLDHLRRTVNKFEKLLRVLEEYFDVQSTVTLSLETVSEPKATVLRFSWPFPSCKARWTCLSVVFRRL